MLSTFEIRVTSCRNVLELEQIEAVPEQIKALESRFANHDILANLPTGFGLSERGIPRSLVSAS